MTDSKHLSDTSIMAAYDAAPEGFVYADTKNQRGTKKSANKYMDVMVTLANGKKKKLGFGWKLQTLRGGIKKPSERKDYAPTIQFRRSSGNLGEAAYLAYKRLEAQVATEKKSGVIKTKKGKDNFCTIIQDELESGEDLDDPIIRFKLPFDKEGKPMFRLVKIENRGGKNRSVNVECNSQNIHLKVKSRMLTSGYVSADTMVFSGFGISVPAKVQLLIIKDAEPNAPDPDEFMTEEEMLAMAGDPDDGADDADGDDADGADDADDADGADDADDADGDGDGDGDGDDANTTLSAEEGLEALRLAAADGDE